MKVTDKSIELRLKRNKVFKESFVSGLCMVSKLVDVSVETIDEHWINITVKKVLVNGKEYSVNEDFEVKPVYKGLIIHGLNNIDDGQYTFKRLNNITNYQAWTGHQREIVWSISKVFEKLDKL